MPTAPSDPATASSIDSFRLAMPSVVIRPSGCSRAAPQISVRVNDWNAAAPPMRRSQRQCTTNSTTATMSENRLVVSERCAATGGLSPATRPHDPALPRPVKGNVARGERDKEKGDGAD